MAKNRRVCHLLLRFLAFAATFTAVVVMVTSHEKASFFTISFEAKYTNSPAFKKLALAISSSHGSGVHHVTYLKHICSFGYSSSGKERKQLCSLATNM
ncbi:Casparian strip membrane protein [Sesbania bispinosa]|nr:Casparian strip membrane protein [Sesbania bispinosa]